MKIGQKIVPRNRFHIQNTIESKQNLSIEFIDLLAISELILLAHMSIR
jgi:hypothetical protein